MKKLNLAICIAMALMLYAPNTSTMQKIGIKPEAKPKITPKKTLTIDEEKLLEKTLKDSSKTDQDCIDLIFSKLKIGPNYKLDNLPIIFTAIRFNRIKLLKELINKGVDLNVKNNTGKTPVEVAKFIGSSEEIINLLSSKQTKIGEAKKTEKTTPDKKQKTYTNTLKDINEQLLTETLNEETKTDQDCIKLIEKLNVNPNYKFKDGSYIIHWAAYKNRIELLDYLIEKNIDPNVQANNGQTPLHYAASFDKPDIVTNLLKKSADHNIRDNKHKKPIDLATTGSKSYEYLIEKEKTVSTEQNNSINLSILLDDDDENLRIKNSSSPLIAITNTLLDILKLESATIASSVLLENLNLMAKKEPDSLYAKTISNIFSNKKWLIFLTKDKNFIIFIPKSRFPKINSLLDLSETGLNTSIIDPTNYGDQINATKLLNEIKNQETVNATTLENIFLDAQKKDLRIYISGHGMEKFHHDYKESRESIARLEPKEYSSLEKKLNQAGCSFLIVDTCFGAGNIFIMITLNKEFAEQKKETLPSKQEPNNFIEVAIGIPGFSTYAGFISFAKLNINLNNFFDKEKADAIKKLENAKIQKPELEFAKTKITEQQILTGKIKINANGLQKDIEPLISRKKDIKQSPEIIAGLKEFIYAREKNIPRVRFPGENSMSPLKEVFPKNLIESAKNLLQGKLSKLKNKLTELKKEQEKFKKTPTASDTEAFGKRVEEEIKYLNIKIKDTTDYIAQLS